MKKKYVVTPARKRTMKANAAKARMAKHARRESLDHAINYPAASTESGLSLEEYHRARSAGRQTGFAEGLQEGLRALQRTQEALLNAALYRSER